MKLLPHGVNGVVGRQAFPLEIRSCLSNHGQFFVLHILVENGPHLSQEHVPTTYYGQAHKPEIIIVVFW